MRTQLLTARLVILTIISLRTPTQSATDTSSTPTIHSRTSGYAQQTHRFVKSAVNQLCNQNKPWWA